MEIDFREAPEAGRAERVLSSISDLGPKELLTVLSNEDPVTIVDSVRNVLGDSVDVQTIRWGLADLGWILHVKKSRMHSAYDPGDAS